jgi:hypothetical protein
MATKPNFVFVDVPERPKANSIAVKRQRLIEGLTKQAADVDFHLEVSRFNG